MTERRRRRRDRTNEAALHLFFGARRQDELPYFGPLMKLPKSLIDVELAFSREPDRPKEYVQDRLRARAEDVANLLADENTHLYICGHKRMEEGVVEALTDIVGARGVDWQETAEQMRLQGRFHVETYY